MIGAERGRGAFADGRVPGSAPRARVALDVLRRNAVAGTHPGSVADLRADAWGHGVERVARVLQDVGVGSVVIDPDAAHRIRAVGFARDRVHTDAAATLDPAALDMNAVYGLSGGDAATPVMRLSGTVLSVKPLRAGEGVSYGYLHRATADTRVALVSGGYAQGIVRMLGGRIDVAIGGVDHPVIGRVAMDACVVDIQDAEVQRGDVVAFFGDPADGDPSVGAWSRACGLTTAELVTAVGRRATRIYTP